MSLESSICCTNIKKRISGSLLEGDARQYLTFACPFAQISRTAIKGVEGIGPVGADKVSYPPGAKSFLGDLADDSDQEDKVCV